MSNAGTMRDQTFLSDTIPLIDEPNLGGCPEGVKV